jgi:hypothetical protein
MTSNTDMLNDILEMGIVEIAGLPADQLALLNGEAAEALDQAKQIGDRLDGAPDLKYGAILAAAGKDVATGRSDDGDGVIVKDVAIGRSDDGDGVIVVDLSKREKWDQTLLAEVWEVIRHGWRDHPAQCVRTDIKVSKAAYGLWPVAIRQLFPSACTIDTGKPTCRIEPAGKEAA